MVNSTFAALRTVVGVAKEATKGTAVPPTAYPALKSFNAAIKQTKLLDQGWRGVMGSDFGMQNGVKSAELDFSGDVFVDTIGWFLGGIMGVDTTTGAANPYSHAFTLDNATDGQPTSQTWTDNQGGLATRAYPGAQISELTLKFDPAGLLTFDAKALAFEGATATNPTATYTAITPIPSYLGAVTIGGLATATVENLEVSFKRQNVEPVFTLGVADPYAIHVGGLEVTTKFTFVAADESRLLSYLNNTTEALVATFTQTVNQSIVLQMTQHQSDDAKVTRGKAYMEVEGTGRAIFNATDGGATGLSPCLVTVKNAIAGGTFV